MPSRHCGIEGNKMTKRTIFCQRPDYRVTLQEEEGNGLAMDLEISRINFGKIRFLSPVKFENLNVDDIVFINHKEVVLYPEGTKAPPIGEGLNCSAEVTLERVLPSKYISCTEKEFENKLRKVCDEQDAEFISYCHQSGRIKFKVKHFSKYSCNIEEDEDEGEHVDCSNSTGNPKPPSQLGLGGISLKEFQMHQGSYKKQLPAQNLPLRKITQDSNNPDGMNRVQQCNTYQTTASSGGSPMTPRNLHLGEGDNPSNSFAGKKSGMGIHEEMEQPVDASTPVASFTDAHGSGSCTLPFVPTPPSATTGRCARPYASVLQLQSSGSLRSKLMKRILLQEEHNSNLDDELIQQSAAVSTHQKRPNSLLKEALSSETLKTDSTHTSSSIRVRSPMILRVPTTTATKGMDVENSKTMEKCRNVPSCTAAPLIVKEEIEFTSVSKPGGFKDLFGSLHPRVNTSHGKLFGAPRACFTRSGHLITVKNQEDSFGFKGQTNISVFESYSEKQEAFPFSNSYRDTLKSQLKLNLKRDGEVLFKEHAEIVKNQLAGTNLPKSRECLKSELVVWELCDILWPEEVASSNKEEMRDDGFLLTQRRKLCEWLVENGSFIFGNAYNSDDNSVFGLLKKGKVEDACDKALSEGNDMLAVVLSSKADSVLDCKGIEEVFQFFPPQSLNVMNLSNGTLALEELTVNAVSNMWSYNWLQYYALYLWYYGSCKNMAVDHTVRNFEMMMREIAGDDQVCLPNVECSTVATLCVHLLKLYSCTGYPVKKLLTPQVWTNDGLDYKLSWLLMKSLEAVGYIPENEVYSNICVAFSGQLEQIDMFEWAVFVSKCHLPPEPEDDAALEKAIEARDLHELRLLEKYIDNGHDNLDKEKFLTVELGVDERIIYTIKGERASAVQRYDQVIGYFRKICEFQKAFDVLKLYLNDYGVDVVGGKFNGYSGNVLKHLLTLYPFRKRITGWDIHGKLMVNFFRLSRVEKILTGTSLSTSTSQINEEEYMESALLGFMKAIVKYEPKSERQRAFLLELTMTAQKSIEMMLVDKKVKMSTKDKIKEALVPFLSISVPKDYFEDCKAFIDNMIINDICSCTTDQQQ